MVGSISNGADFIHFHHVIDLKRFKNEQMTFRQSILHQVENSKIDPDSNPKIKEITNLLDCCGMEMNEIHTWFHASQSRHPRQVLGWVTAIFSTGLSIYNTVEIQSLKSSVYDLNRRQATLVRNQAKIIHS